VFKISNSYFFSILFCLFILLLLLIWVSLFTFSSFPLEAITSLKALVISSEEQSIADQIVFDIRLPRALVAILCGASLGIAGCIMQGITNNLLASPSILGINAGSILGVAAVSTFAPWFGILGTSTSALLGGTITWLLVMIIGKSWQSGGDSTSLVLAGVAISALCAALTKALILLEENHTSGIMIWLAGTFAEVQWNDFYYLAPIITCSIVGAIFISPKLNLLQLGHEYAISLGISPKKYQLIGSVLVLIIVSTTISIVGSLGFVGLVIPHMARLIIGVDHRRFMPLSILLGACFVLLADILSRAIIFPMETPAGAILAFIGAPYFVYLVRKKLA